MLALLDLEERMTETGTYVGVLADRLGRARRESVRGKGIASAEAELRISISEPTGVARRAGRTLPVPQKPNSPAGGPGWPFSHNEDVWVPLTAAGVGRRAQRRRVTVQIGVVRSRRV